MGALTTLTESECLRLLATDHTGIGRIAMAADPFPVVLPVNYRLVGGDVVFRTDPGGKLDAVLDGRPVAFEVDAVEPAWEAGWSVLIQGRAEPVTDAADLARLRRLHMVTWAGGAKEHYVRVSPVVISGRRLG